MQVNDRLVVATFTSFRAETGASADSVLVNPSLRNRFLELVRMEAGDAEEEPILRRLLNLRKKKRLPRQ